ncbi:MAG TPA: hypothetical protein ENJ11_04185 [Gammaproteobacteria bacterium]|nr:hypothetical protein [Gammaproteobacteria bacterium]
MNKRRNLKSCSCHCLVSLGSKK